MAALAEALGAPLAGTDEAEVPSCPGLDVMFFAARACDGFAYITPRG